jgi:hypothetical protein
MLSLIPFTEYENSNKRLLKVRVKKPQKQRFQKREGKEGKIGG